MILNGPGFGVPEEANRKMAGLLACPLPNALKVIGLIHISTVFVAESLPELSGRSWKADGELLSPVHHTHLPGMHMPFLASTLKLSNRKNSIRRK